MTGDTMATNAGVIASELPRLAPPSQPPDRLARSPRLLSVSPDGEGEYRSIARAIRQAPPGARIVVYPGMYLESLVIDRPVEIVCAGPPGSVVVEATGEPCLVMHAREATVKGLALRAGPRQGRKDRHVVDIPTGRLVLEDCRISSAGMACIAVHGPHARPVIRGCTIELGREAGVLFYDMSEGVLEDCAISRCGTGIIIRRYAGPTIRRCAIKDAVSYGIHADAYAEGVVEACLIHGNGHAGVCIDHGSMLAVRNCTIRQNERAVGVAADGGGVVEHCDLTGNLLGAWSIRPGADLLLRRSYNLV
jgi:nitrous oxidase accessory protein NosD